MDDKSVKSDGVGVGMNESGVDESGENATAQISRSHTEKELSAKGFDPRKDGEEASEGQPTNEVVNEFIGG